MDKTNFKWIASLTTGIYYVNNPLDETDDGYEMDSKYLIRIEFVAHGWHVHILNGFEERFLNYSATDVLQVKYCAEEFLIEIMNKLKGFYE